MSDIDRHSLTWRVIERRVNAEIESLRDALEAPRDETDSAALRGQIMALRRVLAWADAPRQPTPPVPGY